MSHKISFEEWFGQVKIAFAKAGLTLPEDIEMMELSHMECMEDGKSIEEFVKEAAAEQKGS